jgi:hypothetical protein
MRRVVWILIVLVVLVAGAFLHYTLPRHAVVRIVGEESRLETFGFNRHFYAGRPPGTGDSLSVDVRYMQSFRPDGRELVFRNEDTGWGWPPYFKSNSADLQARARDAVSTSADPRWVAVTYYGIRSTWFSIYPNVLRLRVVDGPQDQPWPVARIVAFAGLGFLALWLGTIWRRMGRRQRLARLAAEAAGQPPLPFWRRIFRRRS